MARRDGENGGKVYVDIEPDASKFQERLSRQLDAKTAKLGESIGRRISQQIAASISAGLSQGFGDSGGGSRPAREGGKRAGEAYAGEFDRIVRSKIQSALRSLPPIKIGAATSEAEQKLRDLQAQLKDLSGKEIGINIDSTTALAEVDRIQRELTQLANKSPDVQVRADTATASAKLAAISAEISRINGRDANIDIDVDTGAAMARMAALGGASAIAQGGLGALVGVGASMGSMIAPAAAVAVAAIGAVGPAAIASAGGLGVLVLGFSGVIGAVKAMAQEEGKAGPSASTLASQQARLASTADQVRNAEDALRSAQERARIAQEGLTAARLAARRADEDLASQLANNVLAQRDAALELEDAKLALAKAGTSGASASGVWASGSAPKVDPAEVERDRAKAQLAYDKAKQQVADLALQHQRLTAEQQRSQKAGIEGSDQVVEAKRAIAQANLQVEQATRQVAAAQRAGEVAAVSAAAGAGGGVDKVAQAMAGLSPVGQQFARFLYSLKPAFLELRGAAETALLPGVEAGIRALLPILPSVSANIAILAGVMGELFAQAGQALASPFWVDFFNQMTAVAVPILRLMAPTLLNVAKGFAGIMLAFAPVAPMLGRYLLELSQRFAAFGTSLSANPAFQNFIDYVVTNAPTLLGLLGNLAIVVIKLMIALAPLGQIMLELTAGFVGWLASLDPAILAGLLGVIVAVGAAIAAAFVTTVTGGMWVAGAIGVAVAAIVGALIYAWQNFEGFRNAVMAVWNAIVTAAIWAWQNVLKPVFDAIAFVVVQVLVPAFMNFWNYGIKPVWSAIAAAIGFAWSIIQVVFNAIWFVVSQFLIPVFMMLWQNAVMPVWQGIQIAISVAWAVIQVVFGLIQIGIKVLAGIFMWLWHTILEPVWNGITAAIGWAWERIKPVLIMLGNFIKEYVAPAFRTGVSAIAAAWSGIRDVAKIPVKFVVNTVLNNGLIAGYNKLAKLFNVGTVDPIKLPEGFATGGLIRGPGSGTSDSILAQVAGGPKIRVSNGEYIVPEHAVRRYGVGFFNWLAGKPNARRPGDGSQGLAFAGGGLLDFAGDLWDAVSDPIRLIQKPANALIDKIPGGGWVRDVIGGTARSLLGGLLGWVKSFGGDGSNVAKTRAFLLAQRGKPYIWASAGPEGYDCSGLVSAAFNVMRGRNPYSHTFSTANQAGFFPKPGHGIFTAGWANPGERGGGSVGHTAGLLAGLGFESRGGDGVVIGNGTTSVDSFAHVGTFDQGGYLPPGLTLAYNGLGRPEPVGETAIRLGELKAGGDRSSTIQIYPQRADFTVSDLEALMDRQDALARAGRAD